MYLDTKKLFLVHLAGLLTKEELMAFDDYAAKRSLEFRSSVSLSVAFQEFGRREKNRRLSSITSQEIITLSTQVNKGLLLMDQLGCNVLSPLDGSYPEGLCGLLDSRGKRLDAPFVFCKGQAALLKEVRICVIGSEPMNQRDVQTITSTLTTLRTQNIRPLLVINTPMSIHIIGQCLSAGIIPVLYAPAGLDTYLTDAENPFVGPICDVLEKNGLVISAMHPGMSVTRATLSRNLQYLPGLTVNTLFTRMDRNSLAHGMAKDALRNHRRVFMPRTSDKNHAATVAFYEELQREGVTLLSFAHELGGKLQ